MTAPHGTAEDGTVRNDSGGAGTARRGTGRTLALGAMVGAVLLVGVAGLWTVLSSRDDGAPPEVRVGAARAGERVGTTVAVYLDVENAGGGDRLLRATSPVAARALVHGTDATGAMLTSEGLDVPAGGAVRLVPGGTHLMLEGVGDRLEPGDTFPLTLEFERSGPLDVEVGVVPLESLAEVAGP